MFGGWGIFRDDLMFGIIDSEAFYLKVDQRNRPSFEEAESHPFTYQTKGRKNPSVMSYWVVPPDVFEDADKLRDWATESCAAARRAK